MCNLEDDYRLHTLPELDFIMVSFNGYCYVHEYDNRQVVWNIFLSLKQISTLHMNQNMHIERFFFFSNCC